MTLRHAFWRLALVLCGLAGGTGSFIGSASGSTLTNVVVGDDFFSPAAISIHVNDQVKWTWTGNLSHTSTSNTGLWSSGVHGKGFTFTNTFSSTGSFPYKCLVHPSIQTGTVTVQAAPPVAIHLSDFQRVSDTAFQFSFNANSGSTYITQRSADLLNWTDLLTNTAVSATVTVLDNQAPAAPNFYRVHLVQ